MIIKGVITAMEGRLQGTLADEAGLREALWQEHSFVLSSPLQAVTPRREDRIPGGEFPTLRNSMNIWKD